MWTENKAIRGNLESSQFPTSLGLVHLLYALLHAAVFAKRKGLGIILLTDPCIYLNFRRFADCCRTSWIGRVLISRIACRSQIVQITQTRAIDNIILNLQPRYLDIRLRLAMFVAGMVRRR